MTKRLSVSAPAGGGEGNPGSHSLIMLKPLCGSAPRAQWASPEIVILSRHRLMATGRCLVSPGTGVFYIIAYTVSPCERLRAAPRIGPSRVLSSHGNENTSISARVYAGERSL